MALHFLSMFVLGLGSAFHCSIMCGPLSGLALKKFESEPEKIAIYHLSRIAAYLLLGWLVSLAGITLLKSAGIIHHQRALAWASAAIMIMLAIVPVIRLKAERAGYSFLKPVLESLMQSHRNLREQSPNSSLVVLGFMHGLIPCGMVYGALFLALSSGTWYYALASMFYFGLATSGVLILGQVLINRLPKKFKAFNSQWLMAAVSLILVWRLVYHSHLPEVHKPLSPGNSVECRK